MLLTRRPRLTALFTALGACSLVAACSLTTDFDELMTGEGQAGGGGSGPSGGRAGAPNVGGEAGAPRQGAGGGTTGGRGGTGGQGNQGGGGGTGGQAGSGGAGGSGGSGGVGGAGGSGGSGGSQGDVVCGDGVAEGGEACDSGLPEGNAACTSECQVRCEAADAEPFVDEVTGHCYLLFRADLTWLDSRDACRALPEGGHMVAFGDQREFDLIRGLLKDKFALTESVWTGGNDRGSGNEGNFTWENGEPFTAGEFVFAAGQPNGGTGQNCLAAVDEATFFLHDVGCGDLNVRLCERPPPGRSAPLSRARRAAR